jgi:hypothetical protein
MQRLGPQFRFLQSSIKRYFYRFDDSQVDIIESAQQRASELFSIEARNTTMKIVYMLPVSYREASSSVEVVTYYRVF